MSLEQTLATLCAWCEKDGVFNIKQDEENWTAYIPTPEKRQEFYSCRRVSHGMCPRHETIALEQLKPIELRNISLQIGYETWVKDLKWQADYDWWLDNSRTMRGPRE